MTLVKDNCASEDILLEQRVRFCELFDLYGSVLTEKQRSTCELMLKDDLTVSELAEVLGVTRQAAHDLVKRTRDLLEDMENKLGLMELNERVDAAAKIVRENEGSLPKDFAVGILNILKD